MTASLAVWDRHVETCAKKDRNFGAILAMVMIFGFVITAVVSGIEMVGHGESQGSSSQTTVRLYNHFWRMFAGAEPFDATVEGRAASHVADLVGGEKAIKASHTYNAPYLTGAIDKIDPAEETADMTQVSTDTGIEFTEVPGHYSTHVGLFWGTFEQTIDKFQQHGLASILKTPKVIQKLWPYSSFHGLNVLGWLFVWGNIGFLAAGLFSRFGRFTLPRRENGIYRYLWLCSPIMMAASTIGCRLGSRGESERQQSERRSQLELDRDNPHYDDILELEGRLHRLRKPPHIKEPEVQQAITAGEATLVELREGYSSALDKVNALAEARALLDRAHTIHEGLQAGVEKAEELTE